MRIVDGLEVINIRHHQRAALQSVVPDALQLLIKAAPVQQSGQRVGQRQALHQLELAAQALDLGRTLQQVLMVDAGPGTHARGLADQRLDHLAQRLLADVIAQECAIAVEFVAVLHDLLAGLDRHAIDVFDHARDLGAHACRGLDIAQRDVRIEQHFDIAVAEHLRLRQADVNGGLQRRVAAGGILVPHAVAQRMKGGGMPRHQRQHHAQQFRRLLAGFLISHGAMPPISRMTRRWPRAAGIASSRAARRRYRRRHRCCTRCRRPPGCTTACRTTRAHRCRQ